MRLRWPVRVDIPRVDSAWRFPDFFVVGHAKSGTTAMYEMLCQHPQVYMSPVKEPKYFNSDPEFRQPGERQMSIEEYAALFAGASPGQITGEASPRYLVSRTAASEIAAANPRARIIAVFREPVGYLRSLHLQSVRNGVERITDFREAIDLDATRVRSLRYLERVRYSDQLRRYRAVFPEDQIRVLIYDDFKHDNIRVMREVLGFLGVDETFEPEPLASNVSFGVRSSTAAVVWRCLRQGKRFVARVRGEDPATSSSSRLGRSLSQTYRRANLTATPPPDEELMAELRAYLAPEVRKLSDDLDRDLCALWDYPRG